ncbi:hypothetical protein AGMMS49592_0280 [Endomicrobiia bacterium]|nr:hypothetical protein AGMMS49592_0280 [Endomicrobiia bacterium]
MSNDYRFDLNKPRINGVILVGDRDGYYYFLQNKLIAGEGIFLVDIKERDGRSYANIYIRKAIAGEGMFIRDENNDETGRPTREWYIRRAIAGEGMFIDDGNDDDERQTPNRTWYIRRLVSASNDLFIEDKTSVLGVKIKEISTRRLVGGTNIYLVDGKDVLGQEINTISAYDINGGTGIYVTPSYHSLTINAYTVTGGAGIGVLYLGTSIIISVLPVKETEKFNNETKDRLTKIEETLENINKRLGILEAKAK